MKKIILASRSPRRKDLLKEAGFSVQVVPSKVQERTDIPKPSRLVCTNATLKARAIAKKRKKGIVLGADTVIFFQGKIIGKPKTKKEAFQILRKLQGKRHWVYSGVCVIFVEKNIEKVFYDKTAVFFKKMNPDQIHEYHRHVNVLDKSGAYAINEKTQMILRKAKGSCTNVIGLPMEKVRRVLRSKVALFLLFCSFFTTTAFAMPSIGCEKLTVQKLRKEIEDGKLERGWRALNERLKEANQACNPQKEEDAVIMGNNRRIIAEFRGDRDVSKEYVVSNFSNNQRNRLNGKDRVYAVPEGEGAPWIQKDLVKSDLKGRQKTAKIVFDASHGKVIYEISFKRANAFKRYNAFSFEIKSSIKRARFLLDCGDAGTFTFDYDGMEPIWRTIILPLRSFEGFTDNLGKQVRALQIEINGEEWKEGELQGEIYFDTLALRSLKEVDLVKQMAYMERYRYVPPYKMIEELYKDREQF